MEQGVQVIEVGREEQGEGCGVPGSEFQQTFGCVGQVNVR